MHDTLSALRASARTKLEVSVLVRAHCVIEGLFQIDCRDNMGGAGPLTDSIGQAERHLTKTCAYAPFDEATSVYCRMGPFLSFMVA